MPNSLHSVLLSKNVSVLSNPKCYLMNSGLCQHCSAWWKTAHRHLRPLLSWKGCLHGISHNHALFPKRDECDFEGSLGCSHFHYWLSIHYPGLFTFSSKQPRVRKKKERKNKLGYFKRGWLLVQWLSRLPAICEIWSWSSVRAPKLS